MPDLVPFCLSRCVDLVSNERNSRLPHKCYVSSVLLETGVILIFYLHWETWHCTAMKSSWNTHGPFTEILRPIHSNKIVQLFMKLPNFHLGLGRQPVCLMKAVVGHAENAAVWKCERQLVCPLLSTGQSHRHATLLFLPGAAVMKPVPETRT